jgi:hypothetical protein
MTQGQVREEKSGMMLKKALQIQCDSCDFGSFISQVTGLFFEWFGQKIKVYTANIIITTTTSLASQGVYKIR